MTQLYVIRHGSAKRLARATYVTAPLTELGRKQAELTGEYLRDRQIHFDGFYSSPLRRAIETATLIGARIGQTPTIRGGIQEMEYQEIPLMLALEPIARIGIFNRRFESSIGKPLRFPMIGRVANAVLDILRDHQTGKICIVSHGGVVSSILSWYFPRERTRWWRDTVGNCSITELEIADGRATLIAYDQVTHLRSLAANVHEPIAPLSTESRL
jgi:broad specificity phosphatase PhoE